MVILRRFVAVITVFVFVFSSLSGLQARAAVAGPVIKAVTIDKLEAGPGDDVTVTIDVDELDPGDLQIQVFYRGPDGIALKDPFAIFNRETGKYVAKFTIGSKDRPGVWKLDQINIWDKEFNSDYLKRDHLPNPEHADLTVVNPDFDVTPPVVHSVKVDKQKVTEGESITLSVEASDEQSGVLTVSVFYRNGKYGIGGSADFNPETGKYERVIRIGSPAATPIGTWTLLSVRVEDRNHNGAEYYSVPYSDSFRVIDKNSTAPTPPVVNGVSDVDTVVTGKTEPWTNVTAKIGELEYKDTSDQNGYFSISIPRQAEGTVIMVTATNLSDKTSPASVIIVTDGTAPDVPTVVIGEGLPPSLLTVNEVSDRSTEVTGSTDSGAFVTVTIGQAAYTTEADSHGIFKVDIPVQKAGTELSVIAANSSGKATTPVIRYVVDQTAPERPVVNTVSNLSKEVRGKAEPGSTVTITIGKATFVTTAGADGWFTAAIPQPKEGINITVTATDNAGNVSKAIVLKALDKIAPAIPKVNAVSNLSKIITGKAEAKSTVTAIIGTSKYTVAADGSGNFSIPIPLKKAGTKISVTAKDVSGNISSSRLLTVLDKIAPAPPKVKKVYRTSKTVTGTAEKNSIITVMVGTKTIGTVKTNKSGKFTVKIKPQKRKTKLTITATDVAKNKSKPTQVRVY
ncbi:Ig-like domain-containing protein [Neobacillus mesonae]|uniref:Ig-like domain-containing protein n=1 Tax=Neobacillus mesonae TaxID=1193713 RepID=UPI002E1DBC42|nr:Ig-like domain-containing protein [Neobacillus mesonae]